MHVVIHAGLENGLVELAHHLEGVGVGGRIVQLDDGEPITNLVVHQDLVGWSRGAGAGRKRGSQGNVLR